MHRRQLIANRAASCYRDDAVALNAGERARKLARWVAARRPRTFLFAGWILFALGSYPGYLTNDGILQLYTVRSGDYSDHAPVMTALWGLLEYVVAGPFPMLALQSGLFLFGLFGILRTLLSPRAAAITAAGVLLFPPVFATMAVIWPDPLLAGSLLGALGAWLQEGRRWKIAAAVLLVIACACRPEAALAIIPLALLALPDRAWWLRAGLALALAIGVAGTARLASWALTATDTYTWEHTVQVMDVVGTLRRAKVKDEAKLRSALAGLPLADPATLRDRVAAGNDALNWRPLVHGDKRIIDPIDSDAEARAANAAWRRAIASHPGAYTSHRLTMTRNLLGIRGNWQPVHDDFGNVDLLAPLHHRATASDWQLSAQSFVRAVGNTPLFRPWLYLLLAIAAIVLARRRPLLRNLAISGLVYELTMFVLAPTPDYRYSHWLVAATCAVLAGLAVHRRAAWRREA
jgi:hypothetical protein